MKRKLIKQGGGGCTVYLPKKWVDSKGLSAGSDVEIKETGTYLVIDSPNETKKEMTIQLDDSNRKDITTLLTHAYRQGFDKVIFKNAAADEVNCIKKDCSALLLGFEVSESSKGQCVVESMSEPAGEKYEVLLRRVFFIIREAIEIMEQEFKSKKYTKQHEIEDLRKQLDKYVLFCRRTISKEKMEITNPLLEWELLTFLMHIMHSLHYTYKFASDNNAGREKNNTDYFSGAAGYFNLLYDAYYNKDISKVHEINRQKKDVVLSKPYLAMIKTSSKDAIAASYTRETYRLIQIASSPILGTILQDKLEKQKK